MAALYLILAAFAFISFVMAAFNTPLKINLIGLGLAFWVAILVISYARSVFN